MKGRFASLFLFLTVLTLINWPVRAEIVNRIIAVVDDDIITLNELEEKARNFIQNATKNHEKLGITDDMKKEILNELIEERLTRKKIKEVGIKVSETEIKDAIERIKTVNKIDDEQLLKKLTESNLSLDEYKENVKFQLQKEKLMSQEIKSKVVISEESVKAYYNKNKERFVEPSSIRLSSIFLPIQRLNVEQTLEIAKEITKKLRAGEPFENMAAKYSKGPAAETGGDIGYFEMRQLHPELRKLVMNLKVDEISDPFMLGNFIQIIKITDKKGGKERAFEEVKELIYDTLYQEELEKKFKDFIKELRASSYVKVTY